MTGIANLKLAALAAAELLAFGDAVLDDGVVNAKDLMYTGKLMTALKDAGHVQLSQIVPEATDLDDAERAELAAYFESALDLKNDTVEGVIEQGFAILTWALTFLQMFNSRAAAKAKA